MATQEQIDSFYDFATQQVSNGGAEMTMAELFDLWQVQNPTAEELAESAAAVKAALTDMENGDTGRPFDDFVRELRSRHSIPSETDQEMTTC